MQVLPSQDCEQYVTELDHLLSGVVGRGPDQVGKGREAVGRLWPELVSGGWLDVGMTAAGAAPMADMLKVARLWGGYLVPAPYVTSVMARRWAAAGDLDEDRVYTVAVGQGTGCLVPFGGWPGVRVLNDLGATKGNADPGSAELDGYAPSLGIARSPSHGSDLSGVQRRELAAVWASEALGGADVMFRECLEYAKSRMAYGRAIGSFQAVAHMFAEIHRDLEFGQSATLAAAAADEATAWLAAQMASEYAVTVLKRLVQIYGGIGFTWELGLHWYLRHAVALNELVAFLCSTQDSLSPGELGA
jgi:alkylation response protein AidB-like acyl-CoA dehydrogenase